MLRAIIMSGLAVGVGTWFQLHSVNPWIGEPQTCLLAASGLGLFGLLGSFKSRRGAKADKFGLSEASTKPSR